MKVTSTLNIEDSVASSRHSGQRVLAAAPRHRMELRRQRQLYWLMGALTIGGPLLALPGSIYLGLNMHFGFFAVTVFSCVMSVTMIIAYYKTATGKFARKTFGANEKSAGPYTAEITAEGLTYTAPEWRSEIEWCAILRLAETDELLLIVDDTPRTLIVPKRAFAAVDEQQRFIDGVIAGLQSSFSR